MDTSIQKSTANMGYWTEHIAMADLNSQAIAHLKAGNYQEAIDIWQTALRRFRTSLNKSHENGNEAETPAPSATSPADAAGVSIGGICVLIGPDNASRLFDDNSNEEDVVVGTTGESSSFNSVYNFRFFNRAFSIPTSPGTAASPSSWGESQTSCVLLYNLALAHTLNWRTVPSASEKKKELDMAIQLYKMALSCIECVLEGTSLESDDFLLLQLLAIFNNMGYLMLHTGSSTAAASLGDADPGFHCIEAMQALLKSRDTPAGVAIVGGGNSSGEHSSAFFRDFLFFRWNLIGFLLSRNEYLIAPAA